jgi:phage shock protein C
MALNTVRGKLNAMKNPNAKLLLTVCLGCAVAAIVCAVAAGSHFQFSWSAESRSVDFRFGTSDSMAATILGFIALATGLGALGLQLGTSRSDAGMGNAETSGFMKGLREFSVSHRDSWIGGVCGGLGEHTPLPSWLWRMLFLLLLLGYGSGLLLYIALWICLPEPSAPRKTPAYESGSATAH